MTSISLTNEGNISYPIPEPGTPFKWIGVRTSYNHFKYYLDNAREQFDLLMTMNPAIIQHNQWGEWWEYDEIAGDIAYYRWNQCLTTLLRLCQWTKEAGVYLMIIWGNAERSDIGLTDSHPDPRLHFLEHLRTALEHIVTNLGAEYLPLWWGIECEYTVPYGWDDGTCTIESKRAELEGIKNLLESYGIRFVISGWRAARWEMDWMGPYSTFKDDYPYMPGTNHPHSSDPADLILTVDNYAQGFGVKTGILTYKQDPADGKYMWEKWTAEAVREQLDYVDQTSNLGIWFPDILPEMLNPNLCPEFVSTVNSEAEARGYRTI